MHTDSGTASTAIVAIIWRSTSGDAPAHGQYLGRALCGAATQLILSVSSSAGSHQDHAKPLLMSRRHAAYQRGSPTPPPRT